jgi:epoxyqueuosine reductase QueG
MAKKPGAASTVSAAAVKSLVTEQGADFVGIADTRRIPPSMPSRPPDSVLPGAETVVVFGIALPRGSLESPDRPVAVNCINTVYDELKRITLYLSRFLERQGYRAAAIPPAIPVELTRETRGLVGSISLRHAAVGAGLGVMGRSRLVLTAEWGPRVRLGGVVTTAPLEPDTPRQEELCADCELCVQACPVSAISSDGSVDVQKCMLHLHKYGLANYTRFLSRLFTLSVEEKQKAVRDPYFWNLYQACSLGLHYDCFECLTSCPVGK